MFVAVFVLSFAGTGCAGAWRETVLARVWLLEGTEAVHGAWLVAAHGKEP